MRKSFLIALIFLAIASACNLFDARRGDEPVARAHGRYLYKSDLTGLVTPGTSASDSAVIVKRYIESWIRQQIYLNEAEKNLNPDLINIQRKIEDYRRSLIIFSYENQIINELLDTIISEETLLEYYQRHQDEFKLRDHIVQVNFVKLPVDAPNINLVRRLIRSSSIEDIESLEEYCINHAAGYFLDQESWFIFNDILREVPVNPANIESFLRYNRFTELNDRFYRYFLYIRDFRLEGSVSPLTFQADNIKAIILNHRKQNLINEFRQELYMDAVRNSSFEIF